MDRDFYFLTPNQLNDQSHFTFCIWNQTGRIPMMLHIFVCDAEITRVLFLSYNYIVLLEQCS